MRHLSCLNSKQCPINAKMFFLILFFLILGIISFWAKQNNWPETFGLQNKIAGFGFWAPAFFIIIFILFSLLFLPVYPLSLAAATLFGFWPGLLWTFLGAFGGAVISFALVKYFGSAWFDRLLKKHFQKIHPYKTKLEQNSFPAILILRLLTFIPFAPLNFSLGLFNIRFRDYYLATALGLIPGTVFYVLLGASLVNFNLPVIIFLVIYFLVSLLLLTPFLKKTLQK